MGHRKPTPLRLAATICGVGAALDACGGSAFRGPPEVVYPDAAWAAGIEGDVVVETCNAPPSPQVVSGRPELTAAALEMSTGRWQRPPVNEGTSLESCRQTRFAFRKSPSASEAAALTAAQDTVLVTRDLKSATRIACPPVPDDPELGFIEGVTAADLTIDESGRVRGVALIRSVGGRREAAAIASMKQCTFVPATIGGRPFVSRYRSVIRWALP